MSAFFFANSLELDASKDKLNSYKQGIPTELLNSQCYQSGNTVNFIRANGKHLPKIFCTKLDEDISG